MSNIFFLLSCHTWQDKDLFIQEVFINEKEEPYLILKNLGHTAIREQGIDLVISWDDEKIVLELDSLDPHFRKGKDSSIIPLPFLAGSRSHRISARVDTRNVVLESNEDHNTYTKTVQGHSGITVQDQFKYPGIVRSFDPTSYHQLITTGPIANSATWDNGSRSVALQYWPIAWKELLLSHIAKIYTQETITYPDSLTADFDQGQAFDIYLSYLAHSLYIEHEHLVPWSVNDFKINDLKDLWDAHQFFQYDSLNKTFQYNYERGGAVRIFHPIASYSFAQTIQTSASLSSPEAAITSILNWARAYLHHDDRSGQIYFQSIPHTWYPAHGSVHTIHSCWATGGLIMEYCRALNLPLRRSTIELFNGLHTQLYFPSAGWHLTHADDLYDPLFYSPNQEIPIQSLLLNDAAYQTFIQAKPICSKDTCHSPGTQHTYDRRKGLLYKAVEMNAPFLINLYHESRSEYQGYLRGDQFNNLLIPLLNVQEQKEFTEKLISLQRQEIHRIRDLYERYQVCKNNRR